MNKNIFFLILGIIIITFSSCLDADEIRVREKLEREMNAPMQIVKATPPTNLGKITHMTFESCSNALRDKLDVIVDVRTKVEFQKIHIKDAIHIDLNGPNFQSNVSLLDKSKPLLVYGGAHKESQRAAKIVQALGFKDIYNLISSIQECISIKVPLSKNDNENNIHFQKQIEKSNPIVQTLNQLGKAENIGLSEFKSIIDSEKIYTVDLRDIRTFASEHIGVATNVDWNKINFIDKILTIPDDKPIAIYSQYGVIGNNAMRVMQALGFKEIYNLQGGIEAWNQAQYLVNEIRIEGDPNHLSVLDFNKAIVGGLGTIVDVRTKGEFDIAHIPNAVQVDYKKRNFKEQFSKIDISTPVFLYCRSGVRSEKAANIVKKMGYNVFNLDHGFKDWLSKRMPIIGDAHAADTGEEGC